MAQSVVSVEWPLGNVVKLKGLPFKATAEDVAGFFSNFSLEAEAGVLFKRHNDGRPNGEAFVVFTSPQEARRATLKDREIFGERFGDRYVRVYPTLESDLPDLQAAAMQQSTPHQASGGVSGLADSVVKVKSLPFDANQLDVIHFFAGFKLKPNGVQLVVRSDNKPTGEAFVDFESPDEAARSIKEKDHKVFSEKFGDRYVRLIQVSRKEMQATLALRFGGEGILKMKGIPFKASAADVRKFFAGYKIKPDGISFIMHGDGRPTGMAFIEFITPQEAVRAMEKDRAKFGPEYGERFCMLQLVGRHEMDKVVLQKESDAAANPNPMLNSLNILQAVAMQAAAQAALNNPAVLNNPLLLGSPWLNPLQLAASSQSGLLNSGIPTLNRLPPVPVSGALCSAPPPLLDVVLSQQLQLNDPTGLGSLGMIQAPSIGQPLVPVGPPSLPAADRPIVPPAWMLAAQAAAQAAAADVTSSTGNLLLYRQPEWASNPAVSRDFSAPGWVDPYASSGSPLSGPAVAT